VLGQPGLKHKCVAQMPNTSFLPIEIDGTKIYAGIWQRFGAGIVDAVILIPLAYLLNYLAGLSVITAIIVAVITNLLYSVYTIFFHYHYGATLGKMAAKIKVSRADGSSINLNQAILRSSVFIGFALLTLTADIIALSHVNPDVYLSSAWKERMIHLAPFYPSWYGNMFIGSVIWVLGESVFILLDKRNRAIHDLIADTVVIKCIKSEKVAPGKQGTANNFAILTWHGLLAIAFVLAPIAAIHFQYTLNNTSSCNESGWGIWLLALIGGTFTWIILFSVFALIIASISISILSMSYKKSIVGVIAVIVNILPIIYIIHLGSGLNESCRNFYHIPF
jgi:uncharacterized RDD family membrane protein YckC